MTPMAVSAGFLVRGNAMAKLPLELLNNVEHWRDRAEEARVHAEQMNDPEAKRMMLEIAKSYDKLADRAAERRLRG
jgi:hypothetical protein